MLNCQLYLSVCSVVSRFNQFCTLSLAAAEEWSHRLPLLPLSLVVAQLNNICVIHWCNTKRTLLNSLSKQWKKKQWVCTTAQITVCDTFFVGRSLFSTHHCWQTIHKWTTIQRQKYNSQAVLEPPSQPTPPLTMALLTNWNSPNMKLSAHCWYNSHHTLNDHLWLQLLV